MATETLVLNVEIDLQEGIRSTEELLKRQIELRELQIDLRDKARDLRKSIKEANEEFDATGQVSDDYDQLINDLVQVENELKDVGKAQRLVNKEFEAAGTAEDSFRRMSVEVGKLAEQLRRADPADAGFDELKQQVIDGKQALIEFDQSANEFRSSVGRYSQGILTAFEQAGISIRDLDQNNLSRLQKRQEELRAETQKLAAEYRDAGNIGEIALRKIESQIIENDKELEEVNKELAITEDRLRDIGGIDLGRFAEGFAANFTAQAALDGLKSLISGTADYAKQLLEVENAASTLFDSQIEDIDALTSKVVAISNVFDEDYNDVLRSANALSESFGISGVESLEKVENLLIRGANLSGDFLDQISEYSTFFAQAGEEADDFLGILIASENAGILNDKGTDAIKEAFLSIREGTDATIDAFDGLGLSYEEEIAKINDGSQTFTDLLTTISNRLADEDTFSPAAGAAIADIFKGAGEDAGTFVQNLAKITDELGNAQAPLSDFQRSQQALVEIQEQLADAGQAISDKLLPVVADLLDLMVVLGEAVGENAETIAVLVSGVVAAIAAQKGWNAISALNIKSLKSVTGGFKAFGAALRANPIGAVITALTLLAGAFTFVSNNIEETREFLSDLFDSIGDFLDGLGPFGQAINAIFVQPLVIGFNIIVDAIENFQATLAGLRGAAGAILDNIVNGFNRFGNSIALVFNQVKSNLNIGGIFGDDSEIDAEIARLQSRREEFANAGQDVGEAYTTARNEVIEQAAIQAGIDSEVIIPTKTVNDTKDKADEIGESVRTVGDEIDSLKKQISDLEKIRLNVKAGDTESLGNIDREIAKLETSLSRLTKSGVDTGKSLEESFKINLEPAENSIKDFQNRISALQNERGLLAIGSDEFNAVSEQLEKLEAELESLTAEPKVIQITTEPNADTIALSLAEAQTEISRLLSEGAITQEEADQRLLDARRESLQSLLDLATEGTIEYLDLQRELYQLDIDLATESEEAKREQIMKTQMARREAADEVLQQSQSAISSIIDITNSEEDAQEKRAALDAKFTEIQNILSQKRIIQSQIEIITNNVKAVSEGAKVPFPGNIVAIISIIAALASGIASAKRLSQLEFGGVLGVDEIAAKGTILKGKRHRHGGIKMRVGDRIVEAEDRETVLTRGVNFSQKGRDASSALNQLFGGRRLPGTSAKYNDMLQSMRVLVGSGPSMFTNPIRAAASPIMATGGILQSANLALDNIGFKDSFEMLGDKLDENTEATREREVILPVIETRRQLNNLTNYEASRRS